MKSFLTKTLLVAIFCLGLFLRFWQLGEVPPSLNWDEASNGYNAYSILKTQKDEYGNFLPLTFKSFGDYNLALSVYALVPSIAIFGLNEFAVRFPSALLGSLTVVFTYFLSLKLTKNKLTAIASAFLLAVSPWHLQFSRYDHEANFLLFFSIAGITIFLYGLKKFPAILISAIFFGLAANTYHGAKIWIPLVLTMLVLFFWKELLHHKLKLLIPVFILLLFSTPILLNFQNSLIRGRSVGITNSQNPLTALFTGYLSHYSPNFLFISGDTIGRHSVPGMGQLYVFEFPLILIGIFYLIKLKSKESKLLLAWLLIAPIPASLATPTPHALRSLTFLPLWPLISAIGLTQILLNRNLAAKFFMMGALVSVAAYNFLTYLHLYYRHYPKEKATDWQSGHEEMVKKVEEVKDNYSQIAITTFYGHPYIFTLFYSGYDPKKYHDQSLNKQKFDKYEFFGPSWQKTKEGKALIVTPPWQSHPQKVISQVYDANSNLKFTLSELE